ncbi:Uncharacterised protein [Legionella cherrii]|uniref:Uncharacterized protein n=2 Tax=Legionella cherrii TaxID=28084 RepID=A0A0W0SCE9_9GAMM|nr:hypothetical protein Lche_3150 [Legionella cherrii]VEB33587.1 Uncharacterised protein [Legionella cherrii]
MIILAMGLSYFCTSPFSLKFGLAQELLEWLNLSPVSHKDNIMHRLENHIESSYIRAIISYPDGQCGTVGPRFVIQDKNWNHKELPVAQLADFLNDATGINGGKQLIDKNVENELVSHFSNVISFTNGQYVYNGPECNGPSGFFSANYQESKVGFEKEISLIALANSANSRRLSKGNFSSTEGYAVLQHEIGITNNTSLKPILGSYGAGPCVIIAIWNATTKTALLAHVDKFTSLTSVESLFKRISSDDNDILEVHLHGGDWSSKKQAAQIIELVENHKNAKILSADVCNDGHSKSLAIDGRTGEVFNDLSPAQLEHGRNSEDQLKKIAFRLIESPLELCFDGRQREHQIEHQVDSRCTSI